MKNNISIIFLTYFFSIFSGEGIQYYSQYGQDKWLNENMFKNMRAGFFLDIGAYDGKTISNTYAYEKSLGWSGLCIEPFPQIYKQLIRNRRCICVNGCVADFNGPAKFAKVEPAKMLSGLINHMDDLQFKLIERYNSTYEIIDVNCFKLVDLLNQYNVKKIDYLTIDTEGGEFESISGIDFDAINITVIDIENNFGDVRIKPFLESKGFVFLIRLGVDDIYMNPTAIK